MYQVDWEKIQMRYKAFWNRENHDRPLIMLTGSRGKKKKGSCVGINRRALAGYPVCHREFSSADGGYGLFWRKLS